MASVGPIEKLYAAYKEKAHFFVVYISEAHPNERNNRFEIDNPKSLEERQGVAREFAKQLKLTVPILVDTIDNQTDKVYAGWPDRVYVIDAKGMVALKGAIGPAGFLPAVRKSFEVLERMTQGQK